MKLSSTIMASCFLISTGHAELQTSSIIKENVFHLYDTSISKYEKEYSKIYTELESYKTLQNNWDGYQGQKPSDQVIDTTKYFLTILKSKDILNPNIMVSGTGEIGLYWKDTDKYIEVDFDIEGSFSYFYKINNKIYGEDDIDINAFSDKLLEKLVYFKNSINTNRKTIENFKSEDKFLIKVA